MRKLYHLTGISGGYRSVINHGTYHTRGKVACQRRSQSLQTMKMRACQYQSPASTCCAATCRHARSKYASVLLHRVEVCAPSRTPSWYHKHSIEARAKILRSTGSVSRQHGQQLLQDRRAAPPKACSSRPAVICTSCRLAQAASKQG